MFKSLNVQKFILVAALLVTIVSTPTFSYDPINVPRFSLLVFFGFIAFMIIIFNIKEVLRYSDNTFISLLIGANFWLCISLINSSMNLTEGLFGVGGRQTGFLTYFSLSILMYLTYLASTPDLAKQLVKILLLAGWISGSYGLIQILELDPFKWINNNSPVIGVFGNPNFQSAFMGIVATASFVLFLNDWKSIKLAISNFTLISLALINIGFSRSQQGFFVFFFGLLTAVSLNVIKANISANLKRTFTTGLLILILVIVLDILEKVPWNSVFYQSSVSYRGDFWRAALSMTLKNPIFGVGPDGFRDQYRIYMDSKAASRLEAELSVDSAHNLFLDFSTSGGFPFLIIYLLIFLKVAFSIHNLLKTKASFGVITKIAISCWVAFLSQSFISVNQIGIGIWGWILAGLLLGLDRVDRFKSIPSPRISTGISLPISLILGCILGMLFSLSIFISDLNFRAKFESGNVSNIVAVNEKWPQNSSRMILSARILREYGYYDESEAIVRKAIEFNPKYYDAWKELSLQPKISESEIISARREMRLLNPYGR